jgi:hypothetical protein
MTEMARFLEIVDAIARHFKCGYAFGDTEEGQAKLRSFESLHGLWLEWHRIVVNSKRFPGWREKLTKDEHHLDLWAVSYDPMKHDEETAVRWEYSKHSVLRVEAHVYGAKQISITSGPAHITILCEGAEPTLVVESYEFGSPRFLQVRYAEALWRLFVDCAPLRQLLDSERSRGHEALKRDVEVFASNLPA